MQGLGFAYATAPLAEQGDAGNHGAQALLGRHMQRFNTHPYMAAPVIGAVTRFELENRSSETAELKNALMGPYAALGDSFFWSALKPFSAAVAMCLAVQGSFLAPVLFLLLFNPAHLWVRVRGFLEGWRRGRDGIEFISRLELPGKTRWLRWASAVVLGGLAVLASSKGPMPALLEPGLRAEAAGLAVVLASFLAVKKGLSALAILYGAVALCAVAVWLR
jgi:PTS system mannose-specific IID component